MPVAPVSIVELPESPSPPTGSPPSTTPPAVDWYVKAEASLVAITKAVRNQRPFSLGDLPQIADGMVASLAQDDALLVRAISHQSGPSLIGNLVHTAIFAVKIGMGWGIGRMTYPGWP